MTGTHAACREAGQQRLFDKIHPAMEDVRNAYLVVLRAYMEKCEHLARNKAEASTLLDGVKKLASNVKSCSCRESGKCVDCVCSRAGMQCHDGCGCRKHCSRPGGKAGGLLKEIKKEARYAGHDAVHKHKKKSYHRSVSRSRERKKELSRRGHARDAQRVGSRERRRRSRAPSESESESSSDSDDERRRGGRHRAASESESESSSSEEEHRRSRRRR